MSELRCVHFPINVIEAFGDDLPVVKKCKDMWEKFAKSLYQSNKKAKNDLISHTNKTKLKLDAEKKKQEKADQRREKKKLKEISIKGDGADEDESTVESWNIYKQFLQEQRCPALSVHEVSEDAPELADHSHGFLFQAPEESTMEDMVVDLVAEIKETIDSDPEILSNSASLKQLQKNLGFPDWSEFFSENMQKCFMPFTWSLLSYMKQPSHRTKSLDR